MNPKEHLTNKAQLINYILSGCKPKNTHKVGVEFESFLYNKADFTPVAYEYSNDEADGGNQHNIKGILNAFDKKKWQPVIENGFIIGLAGATGAISLEPAGQFEYSSNPVSNLNDLNTLVQLYFKEVLPILEDKNIGIFTLGFNPKYDLKDLPLMPKDRYNFMYNYMPKVGSLGQRMMKQTCTLQTNMDFSSEDDLAKKFKASLYLQPLVAAMYANSPLINGKLSNYLTYRSQIWLDTDNQRSGLLPFAFTGDFNIEKYVDYALTVPMYFVKREDHYLKIPQITFQSFLSGEVKLKDNQGKEIIPILADFILHLSTLFPDVRLKTYIETRSADCPDQNYLLSLSALFVGLLYDDAALDNAYNLVNKWQYKDLMVLKQAIPTKGLELSLYGKSLKDINKEILALANLGLKNRNLGEETHLSTLTNLVNKEETLAQQKIELFNKLDQDINIFIENISIKS
ncbi:Glutamate--cysteine ligase GshA [Candidatus Hepatincolaceae symbiont of Richtersius coronifer]